MSRIKTKPIKPKDVQPGDIIKGFGVITKIDLEDTDPVFNAPHWFYFDYNDPYFGESGCEIDIGREYELVVAPSRQDKIYKSIRDALWKAMQDRLHDLICLDGLRR